MHPNAVGGPGAADVPLGWNWGAFFLTWIWGVAHGVWISLLMFVPLVNLVMPFVLGAQGNALAWQSRTWPSLEAFRKRQQIWGWVGLAVFLLSLGLMVLIISFIFSAKTPVRAMADGSSGTVEINTITNTAYLAAISDAERQDTDHQPSAMLLASQKALSKAQTPYQRAEANYLIGLSYARAANEASARQYENAAVTADPSLEAPYNTLAELDEAAGNYQLALTEAQKAITLNPNYSQSYFVEGVVLYELGRKADAISFLTAAAAKFPDNSNFASALTSFKKGEPAGHFKLSF